MKASEVLTACGGIIGMYGESKKAKIKNQSANETLT